MSLIYSHIWKNKICLLNSKETFLKSFICFIWSLSKVGKSWVNTDIHQEYYVWSRAKNQGRVAFKHSRKCWNHLCEQTWWTWNRVLPFLLRWTSTWHWLNVTIERLSMLHSFSWYSIFGKIRMISVLTTPLILDGCILFVSLYSQTSNSLFDPLWWSLLFQKYWSTQTHRANCQ